MGWIQSTRDFGKDTFLTLPLLLIGFTFLFGFLTTNTGLIWLFIGQILYVPAITLFLNENIITLFQTRSVIAFAAGIMIISTNLTTFGLLVKEATNSFNDETSKGTSIGGYISSLFNILLIVVSSLMSSKDTSGQSKFCSLLPAEPGDSVWKTPSSWVAEITFFCSYVMANALALFNQPAPTVVTPKTLTGDTARRSNEAQQKIIDDKVFNRKVRTGWVMFISVLVLFILLLMRYKFMDCEGNFVKSILPLLAIITSAFTWFNFVSTTCGVAPLDILGVVTQMVDQNMATNPIVCTGTVS